MNTINFKNTLLTLDKKNNRIYISIPIVSSSNLFNRNRQTLKRQYQRGGINCQFLPPGGSNVPKYVLQLLFSEKSQNC